MSELSQHSEWLSLIEVSGPFLAEPVLKDAFPQGLEGLDGAKKKLVRQAYDEWREAIDLDDPDALKIHRAWIELVLSQGLELDEDGSGDVLKRADELSDLKRELPEHGVTLTPDFAVVDGQCASPLMLIAVYEPQIVLGEAFRQGTWSASPGERMVELCRATGVRLGLVTNGEQWMLVDAPVGAVTTFASWYGRLWAQEPVTLQAFVSLLGIRRFFVDRSEQLPDLLDNSLKYQDEVTDALGEQVRRAVEVLIQALDRAHVDSNRTLLEGVEPTELYEAGLTVMMRIVFLLSAEERGLLLLGDELYEANYAVSTLRMQLRAESEEILERRWDAWSRLLSLFRAVFGGIDHEALRLPALGGSLFDPDRFPFLEGRLRGSRWKIDMARPLPIDNRTVLLLLEAVQLFRGRALSYMALDVEQIGYVYEGLLERTVVRAAEVTLDLDATKSAKNPWVTLPEIEDAAAQGTDAVVKLLKERTESKTNRVRNDLAKSVDGEAAEKLLSACHGDRSLRDRMKPYFHLMRTDPWGYPLVYPKDTFMVASGSDRRETGAHYTPTFVTELIVSETLWPLAHDIAADGAKTGKPKKPADLLDLKICDPAMGSGAFLVQACRWLSERLIESWVEAEKSGNSITASGIVVESIGSEEPLSVHPQERLLTARRLVAERCLYGVDMNPLAVELAKLSIWLLTLAKGRPFGFLDHNLRSGTSLFGVKQLDQICFLEWMPGRHSMKNLFAAKLDEAVSEALILRTALRQTRVRDIKDIETMDGLNQQARRELDGTELVADAMVAELLLTGQINGGLTAYAADIGDLLAGDREKQHRIAAFARKGLTVELPCGVSRDPLHWVLEFPEIFFAEEGFDALIGNPPWGVKLTSKDKAALSPLFKRMGDFETAMAFAEQFIALLKPNGRCGVVLPDSIMLNDSSKLLRMFLSKDNTIESIYDLSDLNVFRSATVKSIVMIIQKSLTREGVVDFHRGVGGDKQSTKVPFDTLRSRLHWANLSEVQTPMPTDTATIGDYFDVKQGYIPYRKSSLVRQFGEVEANSILEGRIWHASEKVDDDYVRELKGKDIGRLAVAWSGLWFRYGPWVGTYLNPDWFAGERVLVREIVAKGSRPIVAARCTEFLIHNPSILCIKAKRPSGSKLLPLLEIYLNSSLAGKFISAISAKTAKGFFPKVLVKDLRALPFPMESKINDDLLLRLDGLREKFSNDDPEALDEVEALLELLFYGASQ